MKRAEELMFGYLTHMLERNLQLEKGKVLFSIGDDGDDTWKRNVRNRLGLPHAFILMSSVAFGSGSNIPAGLGPLANNVVIREGTERRHISLVPCTYTMSLEYKTDSFNQAMEFVSRMAFIDEYNTLDFTYNYRGQPLSIQVKVTPEVAIPVKSAPLGEDAGLYDFTVDFEVQAFISSVDGAFDNTSQVRPLVIGFEAHSAPYGTELSEFEPTLESQLFTVPDLLKGNQS